MRRERKFVTFEPPSRSSSPHLRTSVASPLPSSLLQAEEGLAFRWIHLLKLRSLSLSMSASLLFSDERNETGLL